MDEVKKTEEFKALLMKKISINGHRKELRDMIYSLHKSYKDSRLLYVEGLKHHVWKDILLVGKERDEIARVSSTGTRFLNHWLEVTKPSCRKFV
jgi:hypothetical protein